VSEPSWRDRLFGGFRKTSERLQQNLAVVSTARLDQATLDEVEDALQRLLRERPLELFVDVPLSGRALGARIANVFPKRTMRARGRIAKGGRAAQRIRSTRPPRS